MNKFLYFLFLIFSIITTFFLTKFKYDVTPSTIVKPIQIKDTITKSIVLPAKIKYIKVQNTKIDTIYFSSVDSLLLDSLLYKLENTISYADTTIDSANTKLYVEYFFPPKNKFFITLETLKPIPEQQKEKPINFGFFVGPGIGYGTKKLDAGIYTGIGLLIKF